MSRLRRATAPSEGPLTRGGGDGFVDVGCEDIRCRCACTPSPRPAPDCSTSGGGFVSLRLLAGSRQRIAHPLQRYAGITIVPAINDPFIARRQEQRGDGFRGSTREPFTRWAKR